MRAVAWVALVAIIGCLYAAIGDAASLRWSYCSLVLAKRVNPLRAEPSNCRWVHCPVKGYPRPVVRRRVKARRGACLTSSRTLAADRHGTEDPGAP